MKKITSCLWFDTEAEEAAKFYVSVFKDSKMGKVAYYGEEGAKVSGMPAGSVMTATFELNGQEFMALNGGPIFKFSEAISFVVNCDTQEEIDYYWDKLIEGGSPSQCGWLKDKYGLSWQITPTIMEELMTDPETSERVMGAMFQMVKFDIEKLKEAAKK